MTSHRLTSHRLVSHRVTLTRLPFAAALLVTATIVLAGCSVLEPTPAVTPSPTPTIIDTTTLIGETIDPVETVWAGRDSGGDDTIFTLHNDGTVAVTYGTNSYDDPNDTWQVAGGVLHVDVYLDDANGHAEYTGIWNPETSVIDATMTTTVSNRNLTLTMVQQ